MEPIASTASIVQLLGQTISLVQHISEARDTLRGYPKLLSNYQGCLANIQDTLRLVEEERRLQTASVTGQVQNLRSISQELHGYLQNVARWNRENAAKQYIRVISSGTKGRKELAEILDRLDRARSELGARILLVQVGVTGALHDGQEVTEPAIRRTDTNVQDLLARFPQMEASVSTPDAHSLPPAQNERRYVGNLSFDQARMVNGDIGSAMCREAATSEYRENVARGSSVQVNGRMDGQSFQALLGGCT